MLFRSVRAPPVNLSATGVLALAALAGAGWLAWKTYRTGSGLIASGAAAVNQGLVNVSSYLANATGGPPPEGDPLQRFLRSDAGYTGNDSSGVPVTQSAWYMDEVARRYSYQARDAALAAGRLPAIESNNGAAFGVYPKP